MNVSNCCANSGSAANTSQATAYGGFRQQMLDFKALAKALRSGDISAAQSAFTTLTNDLQGAQANSKSSPLLDPNTPAGKNFKALQDALKSGDLKAAQDAFATLKKDLRGAHHAHGHHHHHHVDNDGDDGGSSSTTGGAGLAGAASPAAAGSTLDITV